MSKLKGIYPALITPFTEDNKINEASLREIVNMNIEKGVSGFYVGGSTAEAFLISIAERKKALEIVTDEVKGRCTVIAHVGSISTNDAIDLAVHAEKTGADVISAIPPFYYKFSFEEIKNYYFDVISSTELKMIVYNFPAQSGVELTQYKIEELRENKNIIGIKHTSQNMFQIERMREANPGFTILNGHDEVFLSGLCMGADGAVGSTYNFMAEKFINIEKLFYENKIEEAKKEQSNANNLIEVMIKVGVLPAIKEILKFQGIECGRCRKPFKEISEEEILMLKNAMECF